MPTIPTVVRERLDAELAKDQAASCFAYCDGGLVQGNPSRIGGSWAWCLVDSSGEMIASASGMLIPKGRVTAITNNYSEFVAALRCLEFTPEGWEGDLWSDSQVTIRRFERIRDMIQHHDVPVIDGIPEALVLRARSAIERRSKVRYTLCGGHPTPEYLRDGTDHRGLPVSKWNVWCDDECNRVMSRYMALVRNGQNAGGTR